MPVVNLVLGEIGLPLGSILGAVSQCLRDAVPRGCVAGVDSPSQSGAQITHTAGADTGLRRFHFGSVGLLASFCVCWNWIFCVLLGVEGVNFSFVFLVFFLSFFFSLFFFLSFFSRGACVCV